MTGVTWDERKPGDWLASNGRWYPKSQRPRNWDTLALPPAPGHGGVTQLHGRRVESGSRPQPRPRPAPGPPGPPGRAAAEPRPDARAPGTEVVPTGRRVADATATHVSTYKRRIERGPAPPASLPAPDPWRDVPPPSNTPAPPAPPGRVGSAGGGQPRTPPRSVDKTVTPADALGSVLNRARKRIEEAIEESSQAGNGHK